MNRHLFRHPLRWLLLLWLSLVYLWGLSSLWQLTTGSRAALRSLPLIYCLPGCTPGDGAADWIQASVGLWIGILTALMLVQGVLLWISLSQQPARGWCWPLALVQGMLALAFCLLVPHEQIALSLFLALMVWAINLLKHTRLGILAATGYLVLYIVSVTLIKVLPYVGSEKWLSLWTTADFWMGNLTTLTPLVLLLVAYLLLYVQHLRAHTKLEAAYARLKDSASRIEALTRLTERQRLARTLHDTLTQDLVGLIRQLEVADSHQTRQHYQRAQEIIQQATQRARLALTEARAVITALREEPLSASDLKRVVQEEINRFTQATGMPCVADLDALLDCPPPLREPALHLIAEGLQNVARHAQAQRAWVRVERVKHRLTLEVRDDGMGFDPSGVEVQAGHYGLLGLQERARLAGGALEINSTAGAGTVLRLHLPDPVKGAIA